MVVVEVVVVVAIVTRLLVAVVEQIVRHFADVGENDLRLAGLVVHSNNDT